MKFLTTLLLVSFTFFVHGQDSPYKISSFTDEGIKAPNTHHIGDAWLNFLMKSDEDFTYNITQATFSPNSTLDWHKHASPQVLIYLEGEGYYQERGKEPIILKKGDVIRCEKETEHWHSSTKDSKVSYLAIYVGSEPTAWTEKLSQEYYDKVAEKLSSK